MLTTERERADELFHLEGHRGPKEMVIEALNGFEHAKVSSIRGSMCLSNHNEMIFVVGTHS